MFKKLFEEVRALRAEVAEKNEQLERKSNANARLRRKRDNERESGDQLANHVLRLRYVLDVQIGGGEGVRADGDLLRGVGEFVDSRVGPMLVAYYRRPRTHYLQMVPDPYLLHVRSERMCLFCGLNLCIGRHIWSHCNGTCENSYYCSPLCQRAHWPIHKYLCTAVSEADR